MNVKQAFEKELDKLPEGKECAFVLIRHLDGHSCIYQFMLDGMEDDHFAAVALRSDCNTNVSHTNVTFAGIGRFTFIAEDQIERAAQWWEYSYSNDTPAESRRREAG